MSYEQRTQLLYQWQGIPCWCPKQLKWGCIGWRVQWADHHIWAAWIWCCHAFWLWGWDLSPWDSAGAGWDRNVLVTLMKGFSFHLWPEADYWLHSAEIFLEGFHKGIIQFTELTLVISEPESRSSLQDDFSECPAAAPLSPLLSPKLLWSQLEWRILSWDFKVLHGRSLQSALGSVDGQVICALTCWQPNPLHSFVSSDSITLKSTRELGKSHS